MCNFVWFGCLPIVADEEELDAPSIDEPYPFFSHSLYEWCNLTIWLVVFFLLKWQFEIWSMSLQNKRQEYTDV